MERLIYRNRLRAPSAFLVALLGFLIVASLAPGFAFAEEKGSNGSGFLVGELAQDPTLQVQDSGGGAAYAVFDAATGALTFVRSTDEVANGSVNSQVKDYNGNVYAGTVFTGFEETETFTGRTKTPWYKTCKTALKSVVFVSDIAPKSTAHWFDGYANLTSVDLSGLNTENTQSMDGMLASKNIKTLTFGTNFILRSDSNAGLVEIVEGTEAEEGGYYTGKWEKAGDAAGAAFDSEELMRSCVGSSFEGTYTRQIVSSAADFAFAILYDDGELVFQRGNETDASRSVTKIYPGVESSASKPWSVPETNSFKVVTFVDCSDTNRGAIKPINMANWFTACSNLSQINGVGNIDVSSVSSLENLFNGCSSLGQVDLSTWRPVSATSFKGMFAGCRSLASVDLHGWENDRASTMAQMFLGCTNLASINLDGLNTSVVTDMEGMFSNCEKLEALDLSNFNTSNVTKMGSMFYRCYALKSIEFGSNFNTLSVTDMSSMFDDCDSLESLDCSRFQTDSVQTVQSMFAHCDALKEVDVSTWDMPKLENMSKMFYLDSQLESVNLKGVSTASATTMESMFDGCVALEEVDVSSFETPNVENMYQMFNKCSKLKKLDLSGFDMGKVTNSQNMFANDYALQEVTLGEQFKFGATPGLTVPDVDEVYGYYNGYWVRTDGQYAKTADDLMSSYDGATMAGTYVWQIDMKDAKVDGLKDVTFTGSAQEPPFTVTVGEGDKALQLKAGEDYKATYKDNVNAGTATVSIEPLGRCTNSGSALAPTFKINPASIAKAALTVSPVSYAYDGTAKKPTVKVTVGSTTLKADTDYTVAYADNVKVGSAKVTVTGKGNYTGTATKPFAINANSIAQATVTVNPTSYTYDGKAKKPSVKVVLGSKTLAANTDYTVSYSNNVNAGTAKVTVTGKGNYTGTATKPFSIGVPAASVSYRTHVQNVGWQGYMKDGTTSGTSGKSLRLEGINVKLGASAYSGGITYRTHVQNIGWQGWKSNGAMAGTQGQSLRLEAIQIKLTGDMAAHYDVYYRVHCQNIGWMNWAKNGASAGSAGYSYRLEAIQIKLVPKGSAAPKASPANAVSYPYKADLVQYRTHVQNVGWQSFVADGATAGTSGRSLRLEGLNLRLGSQSGIGGGITYRTHVQNIGWQGWKQNGAMAGTSGRSLRLEAVQIKLTGAAALKYDVYYRVHCQNIGWMGWAKNGASAGTAGYSYRLEALQVKLVPKGGKAPGSTANAFRQR